MAIFSSKKWGPVRTLEDLKGARTRSLHRSIAPSAALGAVPCRSIIQIIARHWKPANWTPPFSAAATKMFDLVDRGAPYCTLTRQSIYYHAPDAYLLQVHSWNKLPPDNPKNHRFASAPRRRLLVSRCKAD